MRAGSCSALLCPALLYPTPLLYSTLLLCSTLLYPIIPYSSHTAPWSRTPICPCTPLLSAGLKKALNKKLVVAAVDKTPCPHGDVFGRFGGKPVSLAVLQEMPKATRAAYARHVFQNNPEMKLEQAQVDKAIVSWIGLAKGGCIPSHSLAYPVSCLRTCTHSHASIYTDMHVHTPLPHTPSPLGPAPRSAPASRSFPQG
jgi:hypothetical protein